jgi:hypothetical protein
MNTDTLANDLTKETRLSMAAAARRVGSLRGDRPTSPFTVVRWITKGALLPRRIAAAPRRPKVWRQLDHD